MYTTTSRITGMSGVDVESLVTRAMKAESARYDAVKKDKMKLEWKREAYNDVGATLKDFQMKFMDMANTDSNMRLASTYTGKSVSVSGEGVSASALSDAREGVYKIDALRLASAHTFASKTAISRVVTAEANKMDFSRMKAGDGFKASLDGGEPKDIIFSEEEAELLRNDGSAKTVSDVLNAKMAVFGQENGQMRVKSRSENGRLIIETAQGHFIEFSEGELRNGLKVAEQAPGVISPGGKRVKVTVGDEVKEININVSSGDGADDVTRKLNEAVAASGFESKMTFSVIKDGADAGKVKLEIVGAKEDAAFEGGVIEELTGMGEMSVKSGGALRDFGVFPGKRSEVDLDRTVMETFGGLRVGKVVINGKSVNIDSTGTVGELFESVNKADAGVRLEYDEFKGVLEFKSLSEGAAGAIKFGEGGERFLEGLGLELSKEPLDARLFVNGDVVSTPENEFSIYGVNIKLNATTEKSVIITVEKDVEKPLEAIREFVSAYNDVIENVREKYMTNRTKFGEYGYYEPLTDDERDAMSEKDIERWEEEAKKGLLYRDEVLNGFLNDSRTRMYASMTLASGKRLALYDIGVSPSRDYREGWKLVIDEEKLRKALHDIPEEVAELFTLHPEYGEREKNVVKDIKKEGVAERLNDLINGAISVNGAISKKTGYGSVARGSEIYNNISEIDERLASMSERLAKKEEEYYRKFSVMEKAVAEADSQMAALQSMLGGVAAGGAK